MSVQIQLTGNWFDQVKQTAEFRTFMESQIGEPIRRDAERLAPKRTGRMAADLAYEFHDDEVRIGAQVVTYTGDVEVGTSRQQAQPFLRPALFRRR